MELLADANGLSCIIGEAEVSSAGVGLTRPFIFLLVAPPIDILVLEVVILAVLAKRVVSILAIIIKIVVPEGIEVNIPDVGHLYLVLPAVLSALV